MIDVIVTPTDDILTSDFETIRKAVDDWKQTLPLKADKPERRENREVIEAQPRITRISDVISRVLSFPLESKSPMDAYDFLRQLRKEVVALY